MVRSTTVSVLLAIILNSAEKNWGQKKIEDGKKKIDSRIVTAPALYWLMGFSNPGKLFYQCVNLKSQKTFKIA